MRGGTGRAHRTPAAGCVGRLLSIGYGTNHVLEAATGPTGRLNLCQNTGRRSSSAGREAPVRRHWPAANGKRAAKKTVGLRP